MAFSRFGEKLTSTWIVLKQTQLLSNGLYEAVHIKNDKQVSKTKTKYGLKFVLNWCNTMNITAWCVSNCDVVESFDRS